MTDEDLLTKWSPLLNVGTEMTPEFRLRTAKMLENTQNAVMNTKQSTKPFVSLIVERLKFDIEIHCKLDQVEYLSKLIHESKFCVEFVYTTEDQPWMIVDDTMVHGMKEIERYFNRTGE